MKKLSSLLLLVAFTLFSTLPAAAGPQNLFCSLGQDNPKVQHKKGPEVANRVKELQRTNKNVREALASFERNEKTTKHKPRIDDATSMSWNYEKRSNSVSFLKTSFTPAQFIAGSIEVIMIPAYSADGEWQGTLLTYQYDAQGNFLNEYISDVMLLPDPTYTYWDAILEVSFTWEGAFLQAGSMALYDQMGTPQGGWPATSRTSSKPQFQKASLTPQVRCCGLHWGIPATPRMKKAIKCTGIGCGGAALGCGVGSLFFSGAPFAPCFTQGCVATAGVCVLIEVFGG